MQCSAVAVAMARRMIGRRQHDWICLLLFLFSFCFFPIRCSAHLVALSCVSCTYQPAASCSDSSPPNECGDHCDGSRNSSGDDGRAERIRAEPSGRQPQTRIDNATDSAAIRTPAWNHRRVVAHMADRCRSLCLTLSDSVCLLCLCSRSPPADRQHGRSTQRRRTSRRCRRVLFRSRTCSHCWSECWCTGA